MREQLVAYDDHRGRLGGLHEARQVPVPERAGTQAVADAMHVEVTRSAGFQYPHERTAGVLLEARLARGHGRFEHLVEVDRLPTSVLVDQPIGREPATWVCVEARRCSA